MSDDDKGRGKDGKKKKTPDGVAVREFFAILPENKFMHAPTRTMLAPEVVDKKLGKGTSEILIQDRGCIALTWAPGRPEVIFDKCIVSGAWVEAPGQMVFNWYMPPRVGNGDPAKAAPWLNLGKKLWGDQLEHMLDWLAFKVQHPETKINHCIVLGSNGQGIGKDSWLHPVGHAVGRQNFENLSAGRAYKNADDFNAFLENVIVRLSEAHDMKDKRFEFYDKMKDWCAAPPETLTVANKHVKAHAIDNIVGIIITTNHRTDGLYWPPEDRRNYFAWSDCVAADFTEDYWRRLWAWYKREGNEHVSALLRTRDLSQFDPCAPPPKTAAWHAVAAANSETQDAALLDVLDAMGDNSWIGLPDARPQAITVATVRAAAGQIPEANDLYNFLTDSVKNGRKIAHRFEGVGYVAVNNPDVEKGWWRIDGVRQMVYADSRLSMIEQRRAVAEFVEVETRSRQRARNMAKAAIEKARAGS